MDARGEPKRWADDLVRRLETGRLKADSASSSAIHPALGNEETIARARQSLDRMKVKPPARGGDAPRR